MNGRLTIGQLAKLTGVPPKTIRYYEEVGILPPPERSESRYRLYFRDRRASAGTHTVRQGTGYDPSRGGGTGRVGQQWDVQ